MKIFDKLKNALFEEEYVEVEEKPKKVKEKKPKVNKKEIRETYFNNPEEDEKPVAKRIIPQEKKTIETLQDEEIKDEENESFRDQDLIEPTPESKITMVDEKDLISDDTPTVTEYEPVVKRRSDNVYEEEVKEEYIIPEQKEEPKLYQNSKKESFYDNYVPHAYGNYEKQREKAKEGFKPSPIISPIYGIVDSNKLEEQPRREVRITTPISREKMNLDDIRKKAYGSVELPQETNDFEETEETNTLVDLSDDSKTPEVNSITMGDAMEYFEDLGLEYNEDYIDKSKMNRTEKTEEKPTEIKITDNTIDSDEEDDNTEEYNVLDDRKFTVSENIDEDINSDVIVTEKQDGEVVENSDSDNLFDLIDSMYE